jgi:nucleotide-binding universal stress UspA family protein
MTDPQTICVLNYTQQAVEVAQLQRYANVLAGLLGANLATRQLPTLDAADSFFFDLSPPNFDLIIFGEPDQSLLKRLLAKTQSHQLVKSLATSLLIARHPRLPIRKILFIVRAEASDQVALDWVLPLATASKATVTLLPIVPAQPGFYKMGAKIQPSKEVLLAMGSHTGVILQGIQQSLRDNDIPFDLSLYSGEPDEQLQEAVARNNFDLIVIADEPYGRWQRWLLGEMVKPLLRWVQLPVLIAKSTPTSAKEN